MRSSWRGVYFQKAVKVNRKDAAAWNNLGAVEYLDSEYWRGDQRLQAVSEAG